MEEGKDRYSEIKRGTTSRPTFHTLDSTKGQGMDQWGNRQQWGETDNTGGIGEYMEDTESTEQDIGIA